jgi:oxygen-independent coproporphyrinogen-3 oxidase
MSEFSQNRQPVGLYVHIPFCEKKCPYCDFYSVVETEEVQKQFVRAAVREVALVAEQFPPDRFLVDTLFFGGGTPTVLPASEMEHLLAVIDRHFALEAGGEWTVEANPGTVDQAKFHDLRALGFNRISLGVQSFQDSELRQLGRIHTVSQAEQALKLARKAGFENLNLDLIFGLPGQSIESWTKSLRRALAFRPEHISTYNLIYEPDTPFGRGVKTGTIRPLDETVEWDMYRETHTILTEASYQHYEISNFALPGRECRHNQGYWRGKSYLGFGPSAHSFHRNRRWWNGRNLQQYLENLKDGRLPVSEEEKLTREQQRLERIFLSLRQASGLDLVAYRQEFGADFRQTFASTLTRLKNLEKQTGPLLQESSNRLRLTLRGFWLSDSIFALF